MQHSTRSTDRTVPCVQPVTIQSATRSGRSSCCRACYGSSCVVRARILPAMSAACRKFLACWLDVVVQTLILPSMFEGETHHLWPTLLLDTNAVSQWVDVREPLQWLLYNYTSVAQHAVLQHAPYGMHDATCNGHTTCNIQHRCAAVGLSSVCGAVRCRFASRRSCRIRR